MHISKFLFLSSMLISFNIMATPAYAETETFNVHSKDYFYFHVGNEDVTCKGYGSDKKNPAMVGCSINDLKDGDVTNHYKRPRGCTSITWGTNFAMQEKGTAMVECLTVEDGYGTAHLPHGKVNSTQLKAGQIVKGEGWMCKALANNGIQCINSDDNGFLLYRRGKQMLLNKKR